jgi:hypothetical protein
MALFSKRISKNEDLDFENFIFARVCSLTQNLLRSIQESNEVYKNIYKKGEAYLTTSFIKNTVLPNHKRLFGDYLQAMEDQTCKTYFEYFGKMIKLSKQID